ncbi:MAG: type II toxin-antitoxin system VapC family toxin [Pseudonocardiales bacterium]|nr:type II toxin-antitoxin system VapC family toxin [Pseudonocardiales bacterium]
MIYVDSSAIVKLVRPEAESAALAGWLNSVAEPVVTSALSEVEVPRALRRVAPDRLGGVAAVLARLSRMEIDAPVRATAAAYVDAGLRSLDAIHLATAEMLVAAGKTVTVFVSYDVRQSAAAEAVGFRPAAPGRE